MLLGSSVKLAMWIYLLPVLTDQTGVVPVQPEDLIALIEFS